MKTVYKYPLAVDDATVVKMPRGADILCVQTQHDMVCLWALVDTDEPQRARVFRVAGTGHEIDRDLGAENYIGTVQLHGGELVFHVFEVLRA